MGLLRRPSLVRKVVRHEPISSLHIGFWIPPTKGIPSHLIFGNLTVPGLNLRDTGPSTGQRKLGKKGRFPQSIGIVQVRPRASLTQAADGVEQDEAVGLELPPQPSSVSATCVVSYRVYQIRSFLSWQSKTSCYISLPGKCFPHFSLISTQ